MPVVRRGVRNSRRDAAAAVVVMRFRAARASCARRRSPSSVGAFACVRSPPCAHVGRARGDRTACACRPFRPCALSAPPFAPLIVRARPPFNFGPRAQTTVPHAPFSGEMRLDNRFPPARTPISPLVVCTLSCQFVHSHLPSSAKPRFLFRRWPGFGEFFARFCAGASLERPDHAPNG